MLTVPVVTGTAVPVLVEATTAVTEIKAGVVNVGPKAILVEIVSGIVTSTPETSETVLIPYARQMAAPQATAFEPAGAALPTVGAPAVTPAGNDRVH
jgi:hypothetical protein